MSVLNTKTDRPLKAIVLALLILLVGFAARQGMASLRKPAEVRTPPPMVVAVAAQKVELGDMHPRVEGHGRIRALESVDLAPEVNAVILPRSFALRPGTQFRAGQVLVRLDDASASNNYRAAVGDLLNALAAVLPDLRADWPDQAPLWENYFQNISFDSLPEMPQLPQGPTRLFLARHRIFQLHFQASNLLINWQRHILRAPFGGTVVSSAANPQGLARVGTPLARLVRTDILEMEVPLPARVVDPLKPGISVEVRIPALGAEVEGVVDRIGAVLDERSQKRSVFLRIRPGNAEVLDGMYGTVVMESPALPAAFALPRTALWQGDKALVVRGGLLEFVPVLIAQMDLERAFIVEGLSPGDTVITATLQDPMTGMRIRPLLPGNSNQERDPSGDR